MRWQGRKQSSRVEDRRGRRVVGGRGLAVGGGGAVVLVVALLLMMLGEDPAPLLDSLDSGGSAVSQPGAGAGARPDDELAQFVSVVLADTEVTWQALFVDMGRRYELPSLVLFDDAVRSACGLSSAAVGPFYCPADSKVYLDLAFFSDLGRRFGAPGDFAQAYVVAHEVGHHVQNQLGFTDEVQRRRARMPAAEANALSVRLELQADCFAGVWGHHANRQRRLLEPGDVEEGLAAAAAIGDDRLQRRASGTVQPESWTHGASEQRVRWLRRGLEAGDPEACDTFGATRL